MLFRKGKCLLALFLEMTGFSWPPCGFVELVRDLCSCLLFCVFLTAIGRTLIPRYFSTVFEGGVTDLYYILKHSKESYHNSSITVDCDQCAMVTQHGKPMFTKVRTATQLRGTIQLLLKPECSVSHAKTSSQAERASSFCAVDICALLF